jgi:hypothetical protein
VFLTALGAAGLYFFDGSSPERRAAPVSPGASLATVTLDEQGNVTDAVVSFATQEPALHLSVPRRTGLAAGFAVIAQQVRVVVDGREITLDEPIEVGETRTVALPDDTVTVDVAYSTSGTFKFTTPTPRGADERGLTLLTPLMIDEAMGLPTTLQVVDGRVRNVGCVFASVMTTCGEHVGSAWVVKTDHATDVLAQLDVG